MLIYGLAIFNGAFLLFQVQPLIAKYILPWFGGSPSVWTTCMLFFQLLLLVGYAYAYLSVRHLRPRAQALLHIALLLAALAALPIIPGESWKPQAADLPAWHILSLLTVTIGLPYFVLSATGPLLQAWLHQTDPKGSPYRLYALSNVGSLLALVSYPFLVEPALSRKMQASAWSLGFGFFAMLCGYCAARIWSHEAPLIRSASSAEDSAPPTWSIRTLWLCLPACASLLLLAVTNQMCQDVAVVPFLWVLPLSLYLLSFIISFESEWWYSRPIYTVALVLSLTAVCKMMFADEKTGLLLQIYGYSAVLFVCCMVCHGELARLKPDPRHLTSYYLMIAAGGALGGVFVAVLAPLLFKTYLELHVGLLSCSLLLMTVYFFDKNSLLYRGRRRWVWLGLIIGFQGLAIALYFQAESMIGKPVTISRNFYGVLRVLEYFKFVPAEHMYELMNGRITHGTQYTDPDKRWWPTAYYGEDSGVGLAMRFFRPDRARRIGIVGLGAGTLATYGKPGDAIRFYEINPAVVQLAETRFTYLADSRAKIEIVLGDARLSMEREAPQKFDLLILDAFSGDAIPVHLLTKEAFEIYERHLKPGGVIAINISNMHFNLAPVMVTLADYFDKGNVLIGNDGDSHRGGGPSGWALISSDRVFLSSREILEERAKTKWTIFPIRLWTDDRTSLFQILLR